MGDYVRLRPDVAVEGPSLEAVAAARGLPAGLYAVGQAGLGGQILWGHGLHIAWAMTSGRLAGKVLGRPIS